MMKLIKRRRFLKSLAGIGVTGAAGIADAAWWEPSWVKVRTLRLPGPSVGLRIAQFTDVHHKGNSTYLNSVVSQINSLKPDLICFTGDLIEESRFQEEALNCLSRFEKPLYGIPGNHDYWANADFESFRRTFERTGGQWLMDAQTAVAGGKINLVGVTGRAVPPFQLMPGVRNLLLSHYPTWFEKIPGYRFDLILSGHSHGGQVRLPWFGALLVPFNVGNFDLGWYETISGPMYVNPGIGCFYLNVRFNCRPEITVFEV